MKITASVDTKLGNRDLSRGKTYDVTENEAKFMIREGRGRKVKTQEKAKPAAAAAEAPTDRKAGK